jgi:hypothetical protein
MSATRAGTYTYAVFAETNLWNVPGFHIPEEAKPDRGYKGRVVCRYCTYSGATRWWPCAECRAPQCPKCGRCECDSRREQEAPCTKCWVSVQARLLVDGRCPNCR